jgi:Transposase DNA-binding/Transposase Tn5 dimerisation domain
MEGNVRAWAEANFGGADLGDARRTQRLVDSAARIALHPEKPFTQVFDWNELRGFYRVCNRKEATLQAVLQPHWTQTFQAMSHEPLVLIVHDTTELDFTGHAALRGAGPIGNGSGRGFLQHNSLAIVPQNRQVLGLAYQQLRVRQEAPKEESSSQRKRRSRESELWVQGIKGVGVAPEGCCWVDVGDRGCDIYEAMVAARKQKHHFLFRAFQNRTIWQSADGAQQGHLLDLARSLPSQGYDIVEIPGRGGRPARKAEVALAATALWVPAPPSTPKHREQPVVAAWVIRIWEPHPPADIKEPLEWVLICSLPSQTLEELKERRDWYCCRWLVEIFHDIEKNGCSEEDRRFEAAERMETCLAVLSVVAVRVFQLRCALDNHPEQPAEQVATEAEIEVVRRWTKSKGRRMTIREFVRGVGKLGGFLGRKCDGEPGVRALWRGYQRLQDMLVGFQLHSPSTAAAGPRCW